MVSIPYHRRIGVRFGLATVFLLSVVTIPSLIYIENRIDLVSREKVEAVGTAILVHLENQLGDMLAGADPVELNKQLVAFEPIVDAMRITLRSSNKEEIGRWERHGYPSNTHIMPVQRVVRDANGSILGYLDLDMDIRSEVLADLERGRLLLLLSLACIGSIFLVSLVIGNRISTGLRDITRKSIRFANGNFNTRMARPGKDEVGVLSQAFDLMAGQIEKREVDIHQAREEAERQALVSESTATARGSFLAIMSHEIRTPMNGILGMATLLSDTTLDEEQQEYMRIIRQSGEALMAILNDALDFTKTEAGKLSLEAIDFDLPSCVEDVVDILSPIAHEKGLQLGMLIDADVPERICGDPGRLRQILINLGGNAIKFTETGSVLFQVKVLSQADDRLNLRFEVVDTGIGVDSESVPRLFLPFTQADSTTTRRYGGTGLGLAICKQLVDLMGGEIGAEGEPNLGSTFWFTSEVGLASTTDDSAFAAPEDLIGLPVLLLDDNPVNLRVARGMLKRYGMTGEDMRLPKEALEAMRRAVRTGHPYRVGVIDLRMPGMNGLELAEKIRADDELSDIRLILLSSMGQRGDAQAAREAGFDGYLTKPVHRAQLLGCISACLSRSLDDDFGDQLPLVTRHSLREAKRKVRVLLAEDNPINQKVAVKMLEKLGCTTDVVENGMDAVRVFNEFDYDLVLMDVQMPDMDGFQATIHIRNKCPRGTDVPIIALTANAMMGDRDRCIEAGMNDYLSKPVRPEDLRAALERWVVPDFK